MSIRDRLWTLLWVVFLASIGSTAKGDSLGRRIGDFQLEDFQGQIVALSDFADSKIVVVCFLGTECPLAKLYGPRIQEMSDEFAGRGVTFLAINSNAQDSLIDIKAYAESHKIRIPILKDVSQKVADQVGATRTPEVFALDANRIVQYQGRVDETFTFGTGVGLAQPNETRADLKIAIEEMLRDEPVAVPSTLAKGCLIGRRSKPSESTDVTYSNQIARIVQKHCLACHRDDQIGPFAMDSYEEVAGWGPMISEVIEDGRMPPWHAGQKSTATFLNDATLTAQEKELVHQWVRDGCPEGDPADLPPPSSFREGWCMTDEPDEIFFMTDKPVTIKAEGSEDYRYYEVDPGFTTDRWIKAAEVLPGNRSVVHHIIVVARPKDAGSRHDYWVAGYAPGTRPLEMPEGWARLIPANHILYFKVHYTPIGTAQTDQTRIGLQYMEAEDVERVVITRTPKNKKFEIPPFAPDHEVTCEFEFRRDTQLLAFFPHMHLRGKSFRYELIRPDNQSTVLLDVPHYDFNWQNSYILDEPIDIPFGSRMRCVASFDNSDANLANPDPTRAVGWGSQSWDEMMIGYFDVGVSKAEAQNGGRFSKLDSLRWHLQPYRRYGFAAMLAVAAAGILQLWRRRNRREPAAS